jgi:hypothetical protein
MAKNVETKNQPMVAERRNVQWVDLSGLRLDPENPRLREGMEDTSQADLLTELAREYELTDLGQSLADNGYFAEEPLVTVAYSKGSWTVVEGNRRLAALKLLNNPDAAPRNLREKWRDLSINRKKIVEAVPILEYLRRDEITPYLGFRHITGVLQWRPYQKAKYICQLVERQSMTFSQIARAIGSKTPTVREHYVAYRLVRQASDQFNIDTDYVERNFGVLRRALSDPDIRDFIGLNLEANETALERPIPKTKAKALGEFFVWTFGDEETSPAIKDSRELKKLGVVLASVKGLESLRATNDLDHAYSLSGGEEAKVLDTLTSASYYLDQALPLAVRQHKSKDVVAAVRKCRDTLDAILIYFPSLQNAAK